MQDKYIAKREKGKHLTEVERAKIEVYFLKKKTKRYIAEQIGVSERTIYREIKRGRVMYRPPKVRPKNLTIGGRYFYV